MTEETQKNLSKKQISSYFCLEYIFYNHICIMSRKNFIRKYHEIAGQTLVFTQYQIGVVFQKPAEKKSLSSRKTTPLSINQQQIKKWSQSMIFQEKPINISPFQNANLTLQFIQDQITCTDMDFKLEVYDYFTRKEEKFFKIQKICKNDLESKGIQLNRSQVFSRMKSQYQGMNSNNKN